MDSLRCVRAHEDSWLVARADALEERHIVRGELGCPVCGTRYPVREGVVDFAAGASAPVSFGAATEALAVRAGALLGLSEPGGVVVLAGEWSAAANELLEMTEGVQLLALDYASNLRSGGPLSLALIGSVIPLAAASVRGIALDVAHAAPGLVESAARALTPGGRLLAPSHAAVPASLAELARDAEHWVAAAAPRSSTSAPVAIGGRR